MRKRDLITSAILFSVLANPAYCVTYQWASGAITGGWSGNLNWALFPQPPNNPPAGPPATGDSVVFTAAGAQQASGNNNIAGLTSLASFQVTGGAYTWTGNSCDLQSISITGGGPHFLNFGINTALATTTPITVNSGLILQVGGDIVGAGAVSVSGGGQLTILGTNSYTGPTTVGTSTLLATSPASLVNTVLNSGTVWLITDGTTSAASIQGTGNVLVTDNGAHLNASVTGVSTYSGTTTITALNQLKAISVSNVLSPTSDFSVAGVLNMDGTSQTIGSLAGVSSGSVTVNNATLTTGNNGNSSNFSGTIGGVNGVLVKSGAGTFTLSNLGANSYTGGTIINGGILSVSASNNLGSGNITFDNPGGTLELSSPFNLTQSFTLNSATTGTIQIDSGTSTLSGSISEIGGAGVFQKTGPGTLILTAANTYSGGTLVNGGTLSADISANPTSIHGNITNNAIVNFTNAASGTYAGNMGGTGQLQMTGAGTLVLTGVNSYSGGTTVSSGTLTGNTGANVGSIQGNILNNSIVNFTNTGASGVYAGNMSGTGQLQMTGSGTLTLSGASSYSGATTISGGGTISISSATAGTNNLGNTSGLTLSTGTLQASATLTLLNSSSTAFPITLTGGGGTLKATPGATTFTVNNVISGTGGLTSNGSGTLVLGGNNSGYSGGTTFTGGGLVQIGAANNLGSGTLTFNSGTLDTTNTFALSQAGQLTGPATFQTQPSTTLTLSGNIAGGSTLTKTGTGILILTGSNSYSGGTTVSAGTLQGDTGTNPSSIQGNITNNSIVNFTNTGAAGVYGGNMSGSGQLDMTGSGTLTLMGSNSYGGGTVVSSGTLAGDVSTHINSIQGSITDNSIVNFTNTGTGTFAGSISGSGQLQMTGAGTLILSGVNSYNGATTVSGIGTLSISAANNVGNTSVVNLAGGTLQATSSLTLTAAMPFALSGGGGTLQATPGATTLTVNGNINGTGGLFINGSGTLILGGTNNYSGGTTMTGGGTVQIGAAANFGSGTLTFNSETLITTNTFTLSQAGQLSGPAIIQTQPSTTLTLSGNIAGTSTLTKNGTGTLILSGSNNYSGGTTVNAGTLSGDVSLNPNGIQGAIINDSIVNFTNIGTGTYAGSMGGNGQLQMTGVGTLVLSGVNSYSGATTAQTGTISISAASNLGNTSVVDLTAGTLQATSTLTLSAAFPFTLSGGGTLTATPGATIFTVNGNIGGSGGLTSNGTGKLVLGGTNNYSGGTTFTGGGSVQISAANNLGSGTLTFNSGTLIATNTFTLSQAGLLTGPAIIQPAATLTLSGNFTGSSSLTMSGAGILILSGNNNYSGGTTVTTGTLQGDTGANPNSIQGSILNNAIVNFTNTGPSGVYSGNMSGLGQLFMTGSGTLTLTGSNSYSGGTTVSSGTLAGDVSVSPNSIQGNILNNSIVDFINTGNGIYSGTMSGTGQLQMTGAGILTLNAANNYSGATTIQTGTISIHAANNLGNTSVVNLTTGTLQATNTLTLTGAVPFTLSGGGTLQATPAATVFTVNGNISGTGGLTSNGTGTLVLGGNNVGYSGGTTFTGGGVVQVGAANNLGSGTLTFNNGTLSSTANFTLSQAGQLTGPATIQTQSLTTLVLSGSFSGASTLTKTGGGTLTVSGSNNYTGATQVSAGVFQAGVSGTFSQFSDFTITSPASLDLNNFNETINSLSGNGNTTTGTGAGGILTVAGSMNTSYTGIISQNGGLTLSGTGTLTLGHSNTYSGPTLVNNGKLQAGASGAFSPSSDFALTGGILDLNNLSQTVHTISGTDAITLGTGAGGTLTTGANLVNTSFSGRISGNGGLTLQGTGIFTLSGSNTYSGTTNVTNGTLQAGATNTFSPSSDVTLTGGILDLNNFSQTIKSLSGTSNTTTGTGAGGILTVSGGTSTSYTGIISQNGGLTITGTGTNLTLGALNTYSGITQVTMFGTLQAAIVNAFSPSSDYTITSPGTLDLHNFSQIINSLSGTGSVTLGTGAGGTLTTGSAANTTYSGVMSGNGALIKQGAGTFTLGGTNTYVGGTQLKAGTISISRDANLGTASGTFTFFNSTILEITASMSSPTRPFIIGNAGGVTGTFQVDSGTATISGTISEGGAGGNLTKTGAGTLALNGTSTYTGTTTVNAGILSVNGVIANAANLVVGSGGTLKGTGTVVGVGAISGTVQPGNSIGTLTLAGNQTFLPHSTFATEVSPPASSLLIVNPGNLTIDPNTTLQVNIDPGAYTIGTIYPIIETPSGTVSGTFSTVNFSSNMVTFELEYLANQVNLALLNFVTFGSLGAKGNAAQVAKCLDAATVDGDLGDIITQLRFSNDQTILTALNSMSAPMYTNLALAQQNNTFRVRSSISSHLEHLYQRSCVLLTTGEKHSNLWSDIYGDWVNEGGDFNKPGFDASTFGALVGYDYTFWKDFFIGASAAYTHSNFKWNHHRGDGNINSYYGTLYLGYHKKWFYTNAMVMGAYNDYEAHRKIKFSTVERTAKSTPQGSEVAANSEIGLLFKVGKNFDVGPFVMLDYIHLHQDSFRESGADGLDLKIREKNADIFRTETGVQASYCHEEENFVVKPWVKLSYVRESRFDGEHENASFVGQTCNMHFTGLYPSRNIIAPAASITFYFIDDRYSLGAWYEGEFGDDYSDNKAHLQFGYSF